MKFTVQQKATGIDVTADVSIGEDFDEAVALCGEEIVYGKYKAAVATAIRARMDTLLNNTNAGKCLSPAQTIDKMENSYQITMGKQRRTDLEKAQALLEDLSSEDREKVLALLKDSASEEAA